MNKVDIIIPTYNRTEYLKRILDYYRESAKDLNIIVADSSNLSNKKLNKTLVKTYPQLNILYVDKFSENLSQHLKFAEMVKYIKNKYCVFCADDDFIVPNGIKECVNFLEKNPEYSAAHGTYIGFYLFKGILGYKDFWWNFRYSYNSIDGESPAKRLASHLSDFTLTLWAVRRTEMVKNCYKELVKTNFDPYLLLMFGELLPDALISIYGKIKRLSTFYAARQYFFSIATNFATLIDGINTGQYEMEYNKFKNCLISNLIKRNNISQAEATEIIDSAMKKYLRYSSQEHMVNRINNILRYTPQFLSKGLRLLHASYLFSKKKIDPIGLIDNPPSKYFNDFNHIRKHVLKYTH